MGAEVTTVDDQVKVARKCMPGARIRQIKWLTMGIDSIAQREADNVQGYVSYL